jgi:DNA-binding SARP family transcriptional activator
MQTTEELEFLVLGPLEVRRRQRLVPVRGRREQAVLTMLLLADGGTITVERLVAAAWDGDPPPGAVKAIRNCVSALRHRLASDSGPVSPIETTPAGYRLPIGTGRLDARDFRHQADTARQLAAAGDAARAAAELRDALNLWRGPALDGAGGQIVQDCAARLDEERMTTVEEYLDLELALGRHRQVSGALLAMARQHPLRERFTVQLMLALYRSGRQAEALDAYLRLAKRLAEDLGIDPTPAVTRLHEAILRHDQSLDDLAALAPEGGKIQSGCPPTSVLLIRARGQGAVAL